MEDKEKGNWDKIKDKALTFRKGCDCSQATIKVLEKIEENIRHYLTKKCWNEKEIKHFLKIAFRSLIQKARKR